MRLYPKPGEPVRLTLTAAFLRQDDAPRLVLIGATTTSPEFVSVTLPCALGRQLLRGGATRTGDRYQLPPGAHAWILCLLKDGVRDHNRWLLRREDMMDGPPAPAGGREAAA
jgi:hypothetical protein